MSEKGAILSPSPRDLRRRAWLAGIAPDAAETPLAGDAGNRRYFRVGKNGGAYILADDADGAQLRQFLHVRAEMARAGVTVPAVLAADEEAGFLLLEDFGDATYRQVLRDKKRADELYDNAFCALAKIQTADIALPPYDEALLRAEMALFGEWYCARHLRRPLGADEAAVAARAADWLQRRLRAQAQTVVHRDYHSRNLMALSGGRCPGVLDFQDAVIGAAAYDIVSLLRDAYIEWPADTQERLLRRYWRLARDAGAPLPADFDDYRADFNVAGAQRGLKVLGIFARLTHRDGKRQFRRDMPAAHRHLLSACAALPELAALYDLVAARPPK